MKHKIYWENVYIRQWLVNMCKMLIDFKIYCYSYEIWYFVKATDFQYTIEVGMK